MAGGTIPVRAPTDSPVSVPPALFRQALAQFASGVTIVTVADDAGRHGFTATSFTSVSLQPPLVLVCAARRLEAVPAIQRARAFGVNLLGLHQQALALRFAGLVPGVEDRFAGIETTASATGSPLFPFSLAWLDCRLWRMDEGGDHVIVIGEVADARLNQHHVPLLYHDRHWRRPAELEAEPTPAPTSFPSTAAPAPGLLALLRDLDPALDPSRYVFVTTGEREVRDSRSVLASIREAEATTLVLTVEAAVERGLPATPVFRRIVLSVDSDLLAVGLLAAVTRRLADAGVACNVLSAFHHDHLLVPEADAEHALALLRAA